MLKKGFIIFIGLLSTVQAQNYNNAQTLFTIANDNVNVGEFVRVYTKNNINNQADFSKASLEEYLSLYQNFRLKVKEAESLGMDTVKTFKNELASYRRQLTPSYLSDRESTDKLVEEAYRRMQNEVSVSHILIFWPNANPTKADSAMVKKEILKIKKYTQNIKSKTIKMKGRKIIFYLNHFKSNLKKPALAIVNDGFVKSLTKYGSLKTYPSSLGYVNWSSKIMKSLDSDFIHIGIKESKDEKVKITKLDIFQSYFFGEWLPFVYLFLR